MPIPTKSMNSIQCETAVAAWFPPGVMRPFVLITGLFFLWGIPNNLNDVLIRQFMKSFEISRFQAGLVQSAFYLGYFLLALPAGLLMKRRGYKSGFLTGLFLFAAGCFLFLPAANSGKYGFFLAALFVMASGLAFLETASNPFVAQLGPTASSEQRLNLAQAFNPLGCITGILVGTAFIFSGVELSHIQVAAMQAAGTYAAYLHKETMRVVAPYFVLGGLALLWAVMIGVTRFPAFMEARSHAAEVSGDWRELLHKPHFLFAVVAQFLYVGASVCTWSYFIPYAKEYAHTTDRIGGILLACTMGLFGIGRFVATALMRRFSPGKIMTTYGLLNAVLLLVGIFSPELDGARGDSADEFLHVPDVSHDLRHGSEGSRPQHQHRWLFSGDGDRWRSGDDAPDGTAGRVPSQHRAGLPDSTLRKPGNRCLLALHGRLQQEKADGLDL